MSLAEQLRSIRLIDQHAHNLLRWENAQAQPFSAAFTESYHPQVEREQARHGLYFRRSLKDLARLLACEPTATAVTERRQELGFEELTRLMFEAAGLEALYLDDGLTPEEVLPLDWHGRFVPTRRLLRIEQLAEGLLPECQDFSSFRDRFRSSLEAEAVGYKSIAAYRTGLRITPEPELARERYPEVRRQSRLTDKPFLDFLVGEALELSNLADRPLQFHTGFGDPDLDLRLANPLHLRPLIEAYPAAPIVLLHAAYPFCREAGFLAHVYPRVYLDFGLAVPFLSRSGMRAALSQLCELAPLNKVMYSSDASRIPDLFYLGALWGRRTVGEVMEQSVADGELSPDEAEHYAVGMLRDNALGLYQA